MKRPIMHACGHDAVHDVSDDAAGRAVLAELRGRPCVPCSLAAVDVGALRAENARLRTALTSALGVLHLYARGWTDPARAREMQAELEKVVGGGEE